MKKRMQFTYDMDKSLSMTEGLKNTPQPKQENYDDESLLEYAEFVKNGPGKIEKSPETDIEFISEVAQRQDSALQAVKSDLLSEITKFKNEL